MRSTNTLIVGSGAAALAAADCLLQKGMRDFILVSDDWMGGTSQNAGSDKQTYYKLSLSASKDSVLDMASTLQKGGMHGDFALRDAAYSVRAFMRLVELGVPFPTNQYGMYVGYQTDHDTTDRATSSGPYTSKHMVESLKKRVLSHNPTILDGYRLVEVLTKNQMVVGGVFFCKQQEKDGGDGLVAISAKNLVLATGAPALLYRDSVFPLQQKGASGAAIRVGAEVANFSEWQYGIASKKPRWNLSGSYQQVVPRYVSVDESGNQFDFLDAVFASPTERDSMVFLKGYEWPFDSKKGKGSSRVDLAVHQEIYQKGRKVYLDFTKNPTNFRLQKGDLAYEYLNKNGALQKTPVERLIALNQKAYQFYKEHGVDLGVDKLEISVSAQHNNGGLTVDLVGETSLSGLFAVGEAAGTFGIVRPGGSALNATQTVSYLLSEVLCKRETQTGEPGSAVAKGKLQTLRERLALARANRDGVLASDALLHLQTKMSEVAGFLRNRQGMEALLDWCQTAEAVYLPEGESAEVLWMWLDTLAVAKRFLQTAIATADAVGSRGGAMVLSQNAVQPLVGEREFFVSETNKGTVQMVPPRAVPNDGRTFEQLLNGEDEG